MQPLSGPGARIRATKAYHKTATNSIPPIPYIISLRASNCACMPTKCIQIPCERHVMSSSKVYINWVPSMASSSRHHMSCPHQDWEMYPLPSTVSFASRDWEQLVWNLSNRGTLAVEAFTFLEPEDHWTAGSRQRWSLGRGSPRKRVFI